MALRARLVAPPPEPRQVWPYHTLEYVSVPVSSLSVGDRRFEAETYLSSGFGIRQAIESRAAGWEPLHDVARVWMPSRLKGIQVSRAFGTPFLAATQVFDIRPTPRKFLALEQMETARECFVEDGTILVTRSGAVGRVTLAYAPHRGVVISDDLLRVYPNDSRNYGWVYAYLHAAQVRAMTTSAKYGHIIKHLETSHLEVLPIPLVPDGTAADFNERVRRILDLRNEAHRLTEAADAQFADLVGPVQPKQPEAGFVIRAAEMVGGRRRLEAAYHTPLAAAIFASFKRFDRLRDVTKRVWWMQRFKRFYGDAGIPYLSADELFTTNGQENKRILVNDADGHREYFVEPGWIVMACSGQVYGLNGAAALMTDFHANTFFSHDLIRIVVDEKKVRAGYVLVALTHRTHGRPLLIRNAYGTSIPHLDPGDVADFPVVRFSDAEEAVISELAVASAKARAEADMIERGIAADADSIIDHFIYG